MRRISCFFIFYLSLIVFSDASSGLRKESPEGLLTPRPDLVQGELSNGLHYVILPHDEPKEQVSLRLYVNAGSLMENESQLGLAHFSEHMAFNGTRHYAAGEMVKYFQRLGMDFGADTNAHTWWNETVYELELPSLERPLIHDALLLMQDYASGILFPAKEIENERGIILAEKRDRDTPEYRAYVKELSFLFAGSLIPQRFTIGLENIIKTAKRDAFLDFYHKYYRPDRMYVVVVGDVDVEEWKSFLEDSFAGIKSMGDEPDALDLHLKAWDSERFAIHHDPELRSSEISVNWVDLYGKGESLDSWQKRRRALILDLGVQMINRRFQRLAEAEEAPISSGGAYQYSFLKKMEILGLNMQFSPDRWADAVALLEQEIRRIYLFGFNEQELEEAKAVFMNAYDQANKMAPTEKSRALATHLIGDIRDGRVFTSAEQDYAFIRDALPDISLMDCHQQMKAMMDSCPPQWFLSLNTKDAICDETDLQALIQKGRSVEVSPYETESAKPFAYQAWGEPGTVALRKNLNDLGITQLVLSNGVRVNYKKTDFDSDTIYVRCDFGEGKLGYDASLPGLSLFAEKAFLKGGLEAHSMDELKRIFAGKTTSLDFSVGEDSFTLSGVTRQKDLDLQLQFMLAYLMHPGFRPEGDAYVSKQWPAFYKRIEHTAMGVLQDEVFSYMASEDPRFGVPEESDLSARQMSELRNWLEPYLKGSHLALSIVGDFDEEALEASVLKTFGALSERKGFARVDASRKQISFPVCTDAFRTYTYQTDLDKGMVVLAWPTDDKLNIGQTRRLMVLTDIFSDRLREVIREDYAEAYSPYSFNFSTEVYAHYGYLMVLISLDPENALEIGQVILDIAADLSAGNISEDEWTRAMEPLLNNLKEWRRNNQYWLNQVLSTSQTHSYRLDWARSMESDIAAISLQDIKDTAQRFLDNKAAFKFLIQPESTHRMDVDEK